MLLSVALLQEGFAQTGPGVGRAPTASRNLQVQAADVRVIDSNQRIALVIGNSAYKNAPLTNPVNDARAIAQALKESGFVVIARENSDQRGMLDALREFGDRLRSGGVGLFYYAGHGMQIKDRNYLIPVGTNIEREDEVAYAAVDAQAILDKMEAAGNETNIMILDACRNNPFTRSTRSGKAGLAQMDAPVGTFVAYSTAPGSVASDGSGANGLYTQHLLTAIRQPGSKVEDVFKQVRANVRRDSQGKQVPWEATSLEGDFYFNKGRPVAGPVAPTVPVVATVKPSPAAMPSNPKGFAVGDRWHFQVVDKFKGEVVRNYSNRIDRVTPDGDLVLNKGALRWDASGNLRFTRSASRESAYSAGYISIPPNLNAGAKTELIFDVDRTFTDGRKEKEQDKGTMLVKGQEKIKTPAGEFMAWRVEKEGFWQTQNATSRGRWTFTGWYVPELRTYVAFDDESRNANGSINHIDRHELTSFSVRGAENLAQR